MPKEDKLFPVEWEIMDTIWEMGGSPSVREGLEYAYPNGEKPYTTVQTIMNNLESKGFLLRKKIGLVNFIHRRRAARRWCRWKQKICCSDCSTTHWLIWQIIF